MCKCEEYVFDMTHEIMADIDFSLYLNYKFKDWRGENEVHLTQNHIGDSVFALQEFCAKVQERGWVGTVTQQPNRSLVGVRFDTTPPFSAMVSTATLSADMGDSMTPKLREMIDQLVGSTDGATW